MINDSDLERIQKIQAERWFSHPYAMNILKELELVYHQPKISGAAIGRSIIGRSGAGKTTILKHFINEHSQDGKCPPLFIEAPSWPSLTDLLSAILEEVNDFKPTARTAKDKSERIIRIFKEIKPSMIIIDEAQNFAEGTSKQSRSCINEIKKITNTTSTPTILAGTDELYPVIQIADQYTRRWRPIKLESYPEGQDFVYLVNAFLADVDLKKQKGFLAPTAYSAIYKYSGGVVGLIKEVLINATTNAIEDGSEKISVKHIRPILDVD